jgi:hypothetical protein
MIDRAASGKSASHVWTHKRWGLVLTPSRARIVNTVERFQPPRVVS